MTDKLILLKGKLLSINGIKNAVFRDKEYKKTSIVFLHLISSLQYLNIFSPLEKALAEISWEIIVFTRSIFLNSCCIMYIYIYNIYIYIYNIYIYISAFFCKKLQFFVQKSAFTQSNSVRAVLEIF